MARNTNSAAAVNSGARKTTSRSLLDKWTFINKINSDQELPPAAKVVAVNLMWHMNCKYEECFPKQTTVMNGTGLSERAVRDGLMQLRDRGWLAWERRERRGKLINSYWFCWDRGAEVSIEPVDQDPDQPAIPAGDQDGQPANDAGASSDRPANPAGDAPANPAGLYEHGKNITRESLPPSSASPQKTARSSPKPCPSADQQPPQEGTAEWFKIEVWNVVGMRFKERFYPTISMAAFKKRLGHEIKRLDNDLRKVRFAMLETLRAEPGLDAWEYFCGVTRMQPKDNEPRMRGAI